MPISRLARFSRRKVVSWLGAGAGLGLVPVSARAKTSFTKGAIIRTVLEDVPPEALGKGATLFHEHLSYSANAVLKSIDPYYENLDLISEEVRAAGKDGVSCMVDAGTRDLGRKVENLRTISQRSGVHIVVGGGHYLQLTYPPDIATKTDDEIVEDFARDSVAERWGALGEIGTSGNITPDERKMLRAVGKFHLRSGLPIFTHTPYHANGCQDGPDGKCAFEQLDIFESQGVDPRRVCIGHLSDVQEPTRVETYKALAKRGAFLGFDTVGRPSFPNGPTSLPDSTKVNMILAVLAAGYEDHVLLSHDAILTSMLKNTGGSGYSTVLNVFVPKLRYAGVQETTIHKILVDNPRRLLAFVPKQT